MDEAREADDFARAHRTRWMNWAIPLAIVVAVLGGAVLYAAFSGKQRAFGEPCERSGDCAGRGATCLVAVEGSICTRYCEQAADCPSGWGCQLSDVLRESGQATGTMMKVCVRD